MSLQFMEQADIVFMREPNSVGVYRILKNRRPTHQLAEFYLTPNTVLVDAPTMDVIFKNKKGIKVSCYSTRMRHVDSNFETYSE